MRKFLHNAFKVLLLVIIFISSMLITMRFAIHGREVVVPKFIGATPQEAEAIAVKNHLLLGYESSFFSSEIPQGQIVSQVPNPGVKVRRGWRVRIAQSLGPQRMVIPSVLGQSPRAAELNLRRRGLELGSVSVIGLPGETPDQVLAQSPPPQAKDVASPKISLLVAAPPEDQAFVMPDLTGMKLSSAAAAIVQAGLKVGVVTAAKPDPTQTSVATSADPIIVRQSPTAGQRVIAGSSINLDVMK